MNWTSKFSPAPIVRALFCGLVLWGLSAQHSVAALFTLADDNSTASFDTQDPANNYNWTVDGTGQLYQQAFWFRVGNAPEQSIHTLPLGGEVASNTNFDPGLDTLFVQYNGNGFQIQTRYVLDGGAAGSGASDMGEQISITNTGTSPLDYPFLSICRLRFERRPRGRFGRLHQSKYGTSVQAGIGIDRNGRHTGAYASRDRVL